MKTGIILLCKITFGHHRFYSEEGIFLVSSLSVNCLSHKSVSQLLDNVNSNRTFVNIHKFIAINK